MKIVGIATRAQITDYLLLYDWAHIQSVGHYGFFFNLFHFQICSLISIYIYKPRTFFSPIRLSLNFLLIKNVYIIRYARIFVIRRAVSVGAGARMIASACKKKNGNEKIPFPTILIAVKRVNTRAQTRLAHSNYVHTSLALFSDRRLRESCIFICIPTFTPSEYTRRTDPPIRRATNLFTFFLSLFSFSLTISLSPLARSLINYQRRNAAFRTYQRLLLAPRASELVRGCCSRAPPPSFYS